MKSKLGTYKLGCGQGRIKKKGSVGERNSFQPTDTYVHVKWAWGKHFRRKRLKYTMQFASCKICSWIFDTNLFFFAPRKPNIYTVQFLRDPDKYHLIWGLWECDLELTVYHQSQLMLSKLILLKTR